MSATFSISKLIFRLNPRTENCWTCKLLSLLVHNCIVLCRFGWISIGNVRNRGRKSARKVLTPEEAENKKHEQIVPISPQQIPDVEAKEDNATLKEAG